MPIVTPMGQSASSINGQSTTYIKGLVLQQCAGAPDGLVDTTLQQVLREFYTMSSGLRATIGPYPLATARPEIDLNPVDQYYSLVNVLAMYLYPYPVGSNGRQWLSPRLEQVLGSVPNIPVSFFMQSPDVAFVDPPPDQNYGKILYVIASLKPVLNTTQLPAISTEQHLDGLMSGVLARLYAMPGKPFTNREASMEHTRIYKRQIALARDYAIRQYGPSDTGFRFPSFAGRGSQRLSRTF